LPNDSPDIFVFMYDENEKVIDRLMIYGKVIVYKDNKYKAPFLFDYRFERLNFTTQLRVLEIACCKMYTITISKVKNMQTVSIENWASEWIHKK